MTPRSNGGELLDKLVEELADGVLEDEETLRAEIEALGGTASVAAATKETQRDARRVLGEARRAVIESKARRRVVQERGRYDSLSDSEVEALWVARTQGFDASQAGIQFRGFEDVTPDDMRSLLEDLDRLEAREEADEDE